MKLQAHILIPTALAIGLAGFLVWHQLADRQGLPEGLIQTNGRLEGEHIAVAGKTPGRIVRLLVKEGDSVNAGQAMAQLDDTQLKAKSEQVAQTVATLTAQLHAAQTVLGVAKQEVPLNITANDAQLQRARAQLGKAQAAEAQAQRDASRMRALLERGSVDRHKTELAELAATAAQADTAAARTGVIQAEQALQQARLGDARIAAKQAELNALAAQLEQARAAQREIDSVLADLTLKAPAQGVVMSRIRDLGEMVAPGSPVFDIVDLDQLYLKVYVPENQIGKIKLGLPAQIYTDAFPDTAYPATLRYIASRAEFTPKEVQTPDERVKLVYAVKLHLNQNPKHQLTPGLPADAVIRWDEQIAWQRPKW
ncbi:HlyD family secretion protein [Chitinivorax tropicus]|uniref:HlyD family secretion protein n=1 Tax=Chitinivorax tropicus TaxID=714531 RepID=A0A840MKW1_9PROT|nr:efflux RND transporter periplasmic adaptor subunit [Chitinivorax tropicus]MBB5016773.1 HlyD family secretion protein [Chitinivorax tropicus]